MLLMVKLRQRKMEEARRLQANRKKDDDPNTHHGKPNDLKMDLKSIIDLLHVYGLTHYHTMPRFDALKIYSGGKHCEKRRNCL